MACTDRKFLLATDLDVTKFACDNGKVTLKKNPLPTASVFVSEAPLQGCESVQISIGYAASQDCAQPGQTAGTWRVENSLGATIASGTDLAAASPITLPSLCGEADNQPWTVFHTVEDACGVSEEVSQTFAVQDAIPTASIVMDETGQICTNVTATLGYAPNVNCGAPDNVQTSGTWELYQGATLVASGSQLAGPLALPDLCAYADPQQTLTLQYQVEDGCGQSAVNSVNFVVNPIPALEPTATITAADNSGTGEDFTATTIDLDYIPNAGCPAPGQIGTGLLTIKQGGTTVHTENLAEGTYVRDFSQWIAGGAGMAAIYTANYPADFTFELTWSGVTDACGTALAATDTVIVDPILIEQFIFSGSDQTAIVPTWAGFLGGNARVQSWGAAGHGLPNFNIFGGVGGYVEGELPPAAWTIVSGEGGKGWNTTPINIYGGGGAGGWSPQNNIFYGHGGGLSGIFSPGVNFASATAVDAILVAAGGGASGNHFVENGGPGGGNGSGLSGTYTYNGTQDNGSSAGGGGTQSAGGIGGGLGGGTGIAPDDYKHPSDVVATPAGYEGFTGSLFQGGSGGSSQLSPNGQDAGGGGGGGYFGGGGGSADWAALTGSPGREAAAGGGGGAGFISPSVVNPLSIAGSPGQGAAPNNSDPNYIPGVGDSAGGSNLVPGGDGLVVITWQL